MSRHRVAKSKCVPLGEKQRSGNEWMQNWSRCSHSCNNIHCFEVAVWLTLFTSGLVQYFLPVVGWTSYKGKELSSQCCICASVQSNTSEGSSVADSVFKRLFPGVINSAVGLKSWVSWITLIVVEACWIVESSLPHCLASGMSGIKIGRQWGTFPDGPAFSGVVLDHLDSCSLYYSLV